PVDVHAWSRRVTSSHAPTSPAAYSEPTRSWPSARRPLPASPPVRRTGRSRSSVLLVETYCHAYPPIRVARDSSIVEIDLSRVNGRRVHCLIAKNGLRLAPFVQRAAEATMKQKDPSSS